jgi:hypothetical protein
MTSSTAAVAVFPFHKLLSIELPLPVEATKLCRFFVRQLLVIIAINAKHFGLWSIA